MNTRFSTILGAVALVALVISAGALVALLVRPQPTVAATNPVPIRQITVVGEGEAKGTPDTAHVQLGVQTEGQTATEALSQNNTQMQALIAKLKELGVADKDIQTSNVSIYPRYNSQGTTVDGYQATNTVSVTIRDVSKAGELLDQVVQAGANNVSGISFSIADPAALRQTALDAAIANARTQAQAIAKSAGVSVGQVVSITQNIGAAPPIMFRAEAAQDSAAGVPIQTGEQTINAQVQVTFELQ